MPREDPRRELGTSEGTDPLTQSFDVNLSR